MTGTHALPRGFSDAFWDVNDPGSDGVISCADSGVCVLKSAGAETRYLVPPEKLGLRLVLAMDTDGGDITIKSQIAKGSTAVAFEQANSYDQYVMADVGDYIEFVAISVSGNLRWHIVAEDGGTLGTQ